MTRFRLLLAYVDMCIHEGVRNLSPEPQTTSQHHHGLGPDTSVNTWEPNRDILSTSHASRSLMGVFCRESVARHPYATFEFLTGISSVREF